MKPGYHYVVVANDAEYLTLPDDPELHEFRHKWVLVRNQRPKVPVPFRTRLPCASWENEERNRLYSVYLRPWTSQHFRASKHVPHITELWITAPNSRRRTKTPDITPESTEKPGYTEAFNAYIRGNVVSEHAARIIRNFMLACLARGVKDAEE